MRAGDLKEIKIDPASLKELPGDNAVRPGGMACQVRAECKKSAAGAPAELSLKLTEFPDPDGTCTYFRLTDQTAAKPDELFSNSGSQFGSGLNGQTP